jgi:hypothetical protein
MPPRSFLVTLFFLISSFLSAQDISGLWVGNYKKVFLVANPERLVVEIFVYNDSLITGASHLYYKNNQYEHYKINGFVKKNDSVIYFSEDSTIAVKLGFMAANCLGNYTMKLTSKDSLLKLYGRWEDNSSHLFHCASTDVWLQKRIVPGLKQTISKKQDKNLERKSDIQSLIEISDIEKDSIEISLYDNGIVDNDSASLYLNDSLLLYNQLVSAKPLLLYISLDKQKPLSKLKLIAEHMGSIPPCTVLMFIKTKKKRYEVNLSSNFNSNAVVEFFLKE